MFLTAFSLKTCQPYLQTFLQSQLYLDSFRRLRRSLRTWTLVQQTSRHLSLSRPLLMPQTLPITVLLLCRSLWLTHNGHSIQSCGLFSTFSCYISTIEISDPTLLRTDLHEATIHTWFTNLPLSRGVAWGTSFICWESTNFILMLNLSSSMYSQFTLPGTTIKGSALYRSSVGFHEMNLRDSSNPLKCVNP